MIKETESNFFKQYKIVTTRYSNGKAESFVVAGYFFTKADARKYMEQHPDIFEEDVQIVRCYVRIERRS